MPFEEAPEPWFPDGEGNLTSRGRHVASVYERDRSNRPNCRRVASCVNACAGIPTKVLEDGVLRRLVIACRLMLDDVDRYVERGGKLTEKEAAHVALLMDAIAAATTP